MTPDPATTQLVTDIAAANTVDNYLIAVGWALPAAVGLAFVLLIVWFFIRLLFNSIADSSWY